MRPNAIPAYYTGLALGSAAEGGHTAIIEILFQRCSDISAVHVGLALINAARRDHNGAVNILFQLRDDISDSDVDIARMCAIQEGNDGIVATLQIYLASRSWCCKPVNPTLKFVK